MEGPLLARNSMWDSVDGRDTAPMYDRRDSVGRRDTAHSCDRWDSLTGEYGWW